MKAALERRVAALEDAEASRVCAPEPMSDMELARRIALILWRADQGDPEYREAGVRIARILAGNRNAEKENLGHAE